MSEEQIKQLLEKQKMEITSSLDLRVREIIEEILGDPILIKEWADENIFN